MFDSRTLSNFIIKVKFVKRGSRDASIRGLLIAHYMNGGVVEKAIIKNWFSCYLAPSWGESYREDRKDSQKRETKNT